MKVLVAADKFRGSLSAPQVTAHVAAGLTRARPEATVVQLPVADGGEGTLAAAVAAGFRPVPVDAAGPTGVPCRTGYAVRDGVAVVELADVSGLDRLPGGVPAPLRASSHGTGEVLREVLDAGLRRVVLGVGGSACTDGGAGLLQALGARVLDAAGADVAPGGAGLVDVAQLDLAGLHPALAETEVVLASDVDNPLLGAHGAAPVFGPQKGADADQVALLERALQQWSAVVEAATGEQWAHRPGAGAAGGVGLAALAVLGAHRRPGVEQVLELVGFAEHLAGAALVVTGEGSLDEQTLRGKTPVGVARTAAAAGVPVVSVSGRCLVEPAALAAAGIGRAYALIDLEPDPQRCMAQAGPLLRRLAMQVAQDWLPGGGRAG
ncbi:glycerate kinase [Rhodococcus sp. X156]|uniref:glycerate kinase n=1 Tax=Rhodococcus sp. X156 TaxID=2499145 RepID=UPI000FDB5270|nr:glycerate kinase [Rhodococcus sp. X156]